MDMLVSYVLVYRVGNIILDTINFWTVFLSIQGDTHAHSEYAGQPHPHPTPDLDRQLQVLLSLAARAV